MNDVHTRRNSLGEGRRMGGVTLPYGILLILPHAICTH